MEGIHVCEYLVNIPRQNEYDKREYIKNMVYREWNTSGILKKSYLLTKYILWG